MPIELRLYPEWTVHLMRYRREMVLTVHPRGAASFSKQNSGEQHIRITNRRILMHPILKLTWSGNSADLNCRTCLEYHLIS